MDLTTTSDQPSLEQVQAQFEQWRRHRGRRRAIPESLWEAAASLYPALSINRISRALGLDYTRLKARVHGQAPDPALPTETAFIEVGIAGTDPVCCTVEMRHRNGSMTAQGVNGLDLMKLARVFWSRS